MRNGAAPSRPPDRRRSDRSPSTTLSRENLRWTLFENPRCRELGALCEQWPDLGSWRLVINGRMRSYFGRRYAGPRAIHIAAWHVAHEDRTDVVDTLRHEAAHVLAGKNAGHGWHGGRGRSVSGLSQSAAGSQKAWAKSPAPKDGPK